MNVAVEFCKAAEPPAIVIEISLECDAPRVTTIRAKWSSDRDRLGAWLATRPDLRDLIEHALELEAGAA